jgi:putative DNA primase/helicase
MQATYVAKRPPRQRQQRTAYGNADAVVRGKPRPPEGPLEVRPEVIPEALRRLPAWVVWRYAQDSPKGHWSKPECQPNGLPADPDDPRTWSSFESVLEAYGSGVWDGIGFELGATERPQWGIVGVDLDHVSEHAIEAERIVALLDSYTERTPGRDGLRVFVLGALPEGRRRRWWVEMYQRHRFLSVTGHRLERGSAYGAELQARPRALLTVWHQWVQQDAPLPKPKRR